jgi:hypothetical protein
VKVNIVVDVSGSMADTAKGRICRMVLNTLSCYARHFAVDTQFRCFLWGEAVEETITKTNLNAEILPCGKTSFSALTALFQERGANDPWLLLSDGNWDQNSPESVASKIPGFTIRAIGIGGDADFFKLGKLAGTTNVFSACDSLAALESCRYRVETRLTGEVGRVE